MVKKVSVILSNRCQCRLCGDIIESFDFSDVLCKCKSVAISGGRKYLKRSSEEFIIDLSEMYEMEVNI